MRLADSSTFRRPGFDSEALESGTAKGLGT
jgi:hypothetical protein